MRHTTWRWSAAAAVLLGLQAGAQEPQGTPRPEVRSAAEVSAESTPARTEVHRPVSVTLLPGVDTNGVPAGRVVTHLGLGLLSTHVGRLEGLGAALGAGWVDGRVRGVQAALAANVAGGELQGLQVALGGNVAAGEVRGAQGALGANVATGALRGVQGALGGNVATGGVTGVQGAYGANLAIGGLTGVQGALGANVAIGRVTGVQGAPGANVAVGEVVGLQAALGANVATGPVRGVQAALGPNVAVGPMVGLQASYSISFARALQGAQASLVNVGGDVEGVQVGLLNLARRVKGVQLGLVNLAGEAHGPSLGLVNLIGNGQLHVQAWASDVALGNVGVKFGGQHLYTLLTVGYQPGRPDAQRWTAGAGLGGHIPLGTLFVDVDAVASTVHAPFHLQDGSNLLAQLRLIGGLKLAPRLAVFAGATANTFLLWEGRDWDGLGRRHVLWERTRGGTTVRLWPGFVAGLQL